MLKIFGVLALSSVVFESKRKQYLAVVIIVIVVVLVVSSVHRVVVKRQPRIRGGIGDAHNIIE